MIPPLSQRCPRDRSALIAHVYDGHAVAWCGSCHGLWLPAAVVRAVAGDHPMAIPAALAEEGVATAGLRCPADGAALKAIERDGIEVDVCTQCGGVWLDHGEIDELTARQAKLAGKKTLENVEKALDTMTDTVDVVSSLRGVPRSSAGKADATLAATDAAEASGAVGEIIGAVFEFIGGIF